MKAAIVVVSVFAATVPAVGLDAGATGAEVAAAGTAGVFESADEAEEVVAAALLAPAVSPTVEGVLRTVVVVPVRETTAICNYSHAKTNYWSRY